MLLGPVMIPIPVLWSYGERSTQQLLSALLQIVWIPKIHSVELFSPFSVFVLLWSLYFLLECVLSEKDRKRKHEKLKNSTILLKWSLSCLPIPCNLDTEQTFFVWKCFCFWFLIFCFSRILQVIIKIDFFKTVDFKNFTSDKLCYLFKLLFTMKMNNRDRLQILNVILVIDMLKQV